MAEMFESADLEGIDDDDDESEVDQDAVSLLSADHAEVRLVGAHGLLQLGQQCGAGGNLDVLQGPAAARLVEVVADLLGAAWAGRWWGRLLHGLEWLGGAGLGPPEAGHGEQMSAVLGSRG